MFELGAWVKLRTGRHKGRYGIVRAIRHTSKANRTIETQYQVGEGWYGEEELAAVVKQQEATPEPSERDIHFEDFAALLWRDIAMSEGMPGEVEFTVEQVDAIKSIIARRAYDLVEHALWQTTPASGSSIREFQGLTIPEILAHIPDMSAWPT